MIDLVDVGSEIIVDIEIARSVEGHHLESDHLHEIAVDPHHLQQNQHQRDH